MHPQYVALFTAIDEYVKAHHRCFVAECFLGPSETERVICIRPTAENRGVLARDRYACKYFRLSLKEAEEVCTANAVGTKLIEKIDRELRTLGGSQCLINAA
jgi:hypothetical protein